MIDQDWRPSSHSPFSYPAPQAAALEHVAHRPWPLPRTMYLMGQSWEWLLFAHWALDPVLLEEHVPRQLRLETYDERAWLGITPFVVRGLRLAGTPPLPFVSSFPELNVRTYVSDGEKPGIWFFSLDAASLVAVTGARVTYHLPYFRARMRITTSPEGVRFSSERSRERSRRFTASYRPIGPPIHPRPGSLEAFLTERYCLYAQDAGGRCFRAEIHHPPWPLQPAAGQLDAARMAPTSVNLPSGSPLLHFADRQDVVIWRPTPMCNLAR